MKTQLSRLLAACVTLAWSAAGGAQEPATPGEGFTIHVTAPHIANGHLVDPMHHYCKVISDEPVIQCLMFDSTDPDARLMGIEYIIAKSITRREVPLASWNRNWHDHQVEIDAGVVAVHDMSEEDAAGVAGLVATTDGIVFMTWWPHEAELVPSGETYLAQAISHEIMTPEEFRQPLMAAEQR